MRTAEELRDEVKALRERAGYSVREIARELGKSPSGYAHYEQRIKEPYLPMKIATALAEALGKRGVSKAEVMALAGEDGAPGYEVVDIDQSAPEGAQLINVLDISASAGAGAIPAAYEAVATRLAFPPEYLRSITTTQDSHLAIISVVGSSMQPTLNHDDIVMVDMTKTDIDYDGMFVIRIGEAIKVKRVSWGPKRRSVIVRSDNPNKLQFPDEEYVEEDDCHVLGRVVWVGAKQP